MICREWVWKGIPLGARQGSGPGSTRTHTEVGLDYIAEPYLDVVQEVWLLGINSRSSIFSPFFLFSLLLSFGASLLPSFQLSFPFYTSIHFPFFIYVSVSPYLGWLLVLSILTSEWLGKAGQHGMSMGLSGDGLHIKVLAAFSLVLLLY